MERYVIERYVSHIFVTNVFICLGKSVDALGGLKHQDVPDLVFQMLLCFNNNEQSLIPDDLCIGELGNVKGAVVRAGWKALNYLYNLRRYTFTKMQLLQLKEDSESLHYDFLLLWRIKQSLFPNKKKMTDYQGNKTLSFKIINALCYNKNVIIYVNTNRVQVAWKFAFPLCNSSMGFPKKF
jgi:hypothetical protein